MKGYNTRQTIGQNMKINENGKYKVNKLFFLISLKHVIAVIAMQQCDVEFLTCRNEIYTIAQKGKG